MTQRMEQQPDTAREGHREFVLFEVSELLCGLDTRHVREINRHLEITPVHRAPEYVRGVINLRGEIVTVIDLRVRFGGELAGNGEGQIVVVRRQDENIGLLVDGVSDVVTADHADIEPPPPNMSGVEGAFFEGIYKRRQDLVAVLNLEELLKM